MTATADTVRPSGSTFDHSIERRCATNVIVRTCSSISACVMGKSLEHMPYTGRIARGLITSKLFSNPCSRSSARAHNNGLPHSRHTSDRKKPPHRRIVLHDWDGKHVVSYRDRHIIDLDSNLTSDFPVWMWHCPWLTPQRCNKDRGETHDLPRKRGQKEQCTPRAFQSRDFRQVTSLP